MQHVARPGNTCSKVSSAQVVDIVVAGEGTNLSFALCLFQLIEGTRRCIESGDVGNFLAFAHQDEANGVAHFGEHSNFALEGWVEEISNTLQFTTRNFRVVGNASNTRLVRQVVFVVLVPRLPTQVIAQVDEVRNIGFRKFLHPTQLHKASCHPKCWRQNIGVNCITLRHRWLNLCKVLVVVVESFGVLQRNTRCCLEQANGFFVHVPRPVFEEQ